MPTVEPAHEYKCPPLGLLKECKLNDRPTRQDQNFILIIYDGSNTRLQKRIFIRTFY